MMDVFVDEATCIPGMSAVESTLDMMQSVMVTLEEFSTYVVAELVFCIVKPLILAEATS